MKKKSYQFFVLITFFLSKNTHAKELRSFLFLNTGIYYGVNTYKLETTETTHTVEESSTNTILNLSTGFVWRYALLGIKYYTSQQKGENKISSIKSEDKVSSLGGTIGFRYNFFQLTYSLMSIQAPKRTAKIENTEYTYKGDSGSIIDLSFLLGYKNIKFGPQFSLVKFKYKGDEKAETKPYETSNIYPFFTISIEI